MPINFFDSPCFNLAGNCQTEEIQCLQSFTNARFGISDANANARVPAIVMLVNSQLWDFTIDNQTNKTLQYKAVDYCIDIFRLGTYDVYDDNSDVNTFSSGNIDSMDKGLIKRCEGLLFEEGIFILFFEIKNRPKGNWLVDARRKFEETILSFKEHHSNLSELIVEPIVSNKLFFRVHQTEMIQTKILKDKVGVRLKVQTKIAI